MPTAKRDALPDLEDRTRRLPDLLAVHTAPVADWAVYLDLPLSTMDKLRAEGRGPRCFRIGRRLYARRDDVFRWLDEMATSEAA